MPLQKAPANAAKLPGKVMPRELPQQTLNKAKANLPLTPQEKDALLLWLASLHQ